MSLLLLLNQEEITGGEVSGSLTADAILLKIASDLYTADAILRVEVQSSFTADSLFAESANASFSADAILLAAVSSPFTADAALIIAPIWTTPADREPIQSTDSFVFISPLSGSDLHFQMEFDKADTFDTGFYVLYDSSVSQTNWEYWDGGAWVVLPSTGLPVASNGNEVRLTVTLTSGGRWYRRVRAGA